MRIAPHEYWNRNKHQHVVNWAREIYYHIHACVENKHLPLVRDSVFLQWITLRNDLLNSFCIPHTTEVSFIDRLIADLQLVWFHSEPSTEITLERIKTFDRMIDKIKACKESLVKY